MMTSLARLLYFFQLLQISIQQKNLAPNGQSTQSTTYPAHSPIYHAVLAIDNDNETCAITGQYQREAWWMLTFPSVAFITYVSMIYRPLTLQRFANYSLHISNSSVQSGRRPDGLCFQHNLSTPNPLEKRTCYGMLGTNVIVYNIYRDPTPFLELCDVKLYGCFNGWTGSDCSSLCPFNCLSSSCYPENGTCVWGCNAENCMNDSCNFDTGVSEEGCKPGYEGQMCNRSCEPGTFGDNCTKKCHCAKQPCIHTTGICPPDGCERGYYGNNCDIECTSGHYGANCSQRCSGCVSDACDRFYGVCTNTTTCKPGWQGEKCNQTCITGRFGTNCYGECHCASQACNHTTGICPPGGCDRGYFGNNCDQECTSGHYGANCSLRCSGCVSDECDRFHGVCTNSAICKPGWLGQKCNQSCLKGRFGTNCSGECHCASQTCDHKTGFCPPGGCGRGYYGNNCNLECKTGSYGNNCAKKCKTCYNSLCERYAGNCTSGCIDGYWGRECQFSCISEADDSNYAVVVGVICLTAVAIAIVVAVIVILRRRSGQPQTKSNEQRQYGQPDTAFYDGFVMSDRLRREDPYAELDLKTVVGKQTNRMEIEDGCTLENSQGQTYVNLGY